MASTQRVVIVDDLDGSTQDVEAVWIGLDEGLYEVDLNAQHRQQLMAVLGPFIARARLIPQDENPPRPLRPSRPAPVGYEHPDYPWIPFKSAGPVLVGQLRAWAGQQGIPMPHRGIPGSVLAYRRRQQTIEQSIAREGGSPTA